MKHDAVDEAAEPETQGDTWSQEASRSGRRHAWGFHAGM
jgi:hypothetical protein